MSEVKTQKEIIRSKCCNSDVRSNGYVGGIGYGWTCNRCDRKCEVIITKPTLSNNPN